MADDRSDLIAKAKAQLALVEQSADDLLRDVSTLGGPAATLAAQRGTDAVDRFQAIVKLIHPLLTQSAHLESSDQRPSQTVLDALWRQSGLWGQQTPPPPAPIATPSPSGSLTELLETLKRVLSVTIRLAGGDGSGTPPSPENTLHIHLGFSAFEATITLQEPGSLHPLRIKVGECTNGCTEYTRMDARRQLEDNGRGILWDRLTTAASQAMHHFSSNRHPLKSSHEGDDEHGSSGKASPLELVVLWLAASAACMTSPKDKTQEFLVVDPYTGTLSLVPSFPDFLNLSHAELWTAAAPEKLA